MKYCPQCGDQNPAESKFCKSCGLHFLPIQEKELSAVKFKKIIQPIPATSRTKSKFRISKKSFRIGGIILVILLVVTAALLFKNQITDVFSSTEKSKSDSLQGVSKQVTIINLPAPSISKDAAAEEVKEYIPSEEQKQSGNSQKNEAVTSPQKFMKSKQAAKIPEFNGIKEYFEYLSNTQYSFKDKAAVQRQMIRENFTGNNFMVTIQTPNGVKTDQITINDLADEVTLNHNEIVIRSLKTNKNNIVTEFSISYK